MNKKDGLKLENFHICSDDNGFDLVADVEVGAGNIVGLIGDNGCGKSTLVNAIAGIKRFKTSGSIFMAGVDISMLDLAQRYQAGLMLVSQKSTPLSGISVIQLLNEMIKNCPIENYHSLSLLFDRFSLNKNIINRDLHKNMSGGESKKLELAIASIVIPKYLLLDEVDSGLDEQSKVVAAEVISQLAKAGTGVLIISHDVSFLARFKLNSKYLVQDKSLVKVGK